MVSDFIARAADAARTMTLQARRKLIVALAAATCAMAGLGFLTAALFIALSREVGTVGAAVCLAGVYGFAAAAIAYFGNRQATQAQPRYEARLRSDTEILAGVIAAFMTGFRATNRPSRKQND